MDKRDSQIRQEQLAQAALALIQVHGLVGLSVARVAREVGLVPSAIYRHFKSKGDLLDAVIALIRERMHGNVAAVAEQAPDALERLRLLLMAHIEVIRQNRGILRVVFSDELHHGLPDKKARVYEMVSGYLNKVAVIVSQGQREGQIRDDVDPGTVAVMFLGLIQPAAILWHLGGGDFDVIKHSEKAWPLFRAVIAAE